MQRARLPILLQLLLLLFGPSSGCQPGGDTTELFPVAIGSSWIRFRLRLPAGCRLVIDGPGEPPRLAVRDSLGNGSSSSSGGGSGGGAVGGELVVKATRRLPGSDKADLLHTFWGLDAGRQYTACLSRHVLLPLADTEGKAWFTNPATCATAETERGPGPTRGDGVAVVCLLGMYILGLMLVATIFWRLHICLGHRRVDQQAANSHGAALKAAVEATRLMPSASMEA